MKKCRRLRTAPALACAAALGLTPLTACSFQNHDRAGTDGRVDVVASFYPLSYLVREIGGEHVAVSDLTGSGVEPHDLELGPRRVADLAGADLVVHLKGLQPAVDEAIVQSEARNRVDAAALTEEPEAAGDEHGDPHGEGDEHGHADAGHQQDGGEHGDPHVWLDPVKYAEIAEGIGKALEKTDPGHARDYRANTATLVSELHELDHDFEKGLAKRSTSTFITTHAAFGHLAERYHLEQEAISGLDPESEPGPARLRDLHRIAERKQAGTVFSETLVSARSARTLARDTGLRTDVLDPIESITDRSRGDDYFEVMRANLAALEKALGAE